LRRRKEQAHPQPVDPIPTQQLQSPQTIVQRIIIKLAGTHFLGTIKLSGKWSLHTEYQFRRNNLVTDWQQGLLRVGINYQVNPRVLLRAGYAWAETYAYGDFPINALGRSFTEHRLFQMVQLSHKEGLLELQHRFMLEQRFVGRYSSAAVEKEDEFPFMHRARYMIRLQAPLKGREIKDKTPYAALYNEIMIGFGKNVKQIFLIRIALGCCWDIVLVKP
jgi:hypothetical protein